MKSSLITLLTLSGIATADYTTTNSVSNTTSNAWYNGITLNLSGTRLTTTPAFADTQLVELVSLSTNIRSVTHNNEAVSITLALTTSDGLVQALSTNTISATGDQTWLFADATISTNAQLYFVFVDSTTEGLTTGYTLQTQDYVRAGGSTVINYGNTTDAISCTYLGSNQAYNMTVATANYAPKVTLVTRDIPSVPEPATATLSLLALAALSLRRRR